jgi:hypothetical protein
LDAMAQVVAVHGINNTYASHPQMAERWIPALRGGLDNAVRDGQVPPVDLMDRDISCVFYGDLFRPAGRFLSGEIPPLTAEDVDGGLELELLLAWWDAAARRDSAVVPPGARTLGPAASARAAMLALTGSRFLARVTERMLVWWLKQVTAYLTDEVVRAAVQKRFAEAIDGQTRVVVAHSLGSVVAYEALCARDDWRITDLVTLGSPIAVPHLILHRLTPALGTWPNVTRWVNITDSGDFVALQPRLRQVYGDQVVDIEISNGMRAHDVERYLSAAATGAAVAAGVLANQA